MATNTDYDPALGWIEWQGGERPVADDTMVLVKFRFKETLGSRVKPAGRYTGWRHTGGGGDIVAYKVFD